MTRDMVNAVIYAVLGTLVESKGVMLGGQPNGHLYTALMDKCSLEEWTKLVQMLLDGGLVEQSNWLIKVTPKGEELYKKMDAILRNVQGRVA